MAVLIAALFVLLQLPSVQTRLAQYVAKEISLALGTEVSIEKLHVKLSGSIALSDFYVEDQHRDTLLYVNELEGKFAGAFFNFQRLVFDRVHLKNAHFNIRQYPGEDDLNIQFILDALKSDSPSPTPSPATALYFWNVNMENLRFSFNSKDSLAVNKSEEMDYEDIDFRNIFGQLKQFSIIEDSLSGVIKNLKCIEKCGAQLHDFNTILTLSPEVMSFQKLDAHLENSKIKGDINFDYDSFDDLSDFVTEVFIRAVIRYSKVNLNDLRFFAPELKGFDQFVDLSGNVMGTIENLRGRSVRLYYGNDTKFAGNFTITGLPDINDTYFNFFLDELKTGGNDLRLIPAYPFNSGMTIKVPPIIDRLGNFIYRGRFLGFIDDFVSEGTFFSQLGRAKTDLRLSFNNAINDYDYSGKVSTESFDLGTLLNERPAIGSISCDLDLTGSFFDLDRLDVELIGHIGQIELNQYNYQKIDIEGMLERKKFNGSMHIDDPNLSLNFLGDVNMRMTIPEFQFEADLSYANLTALKIYESDSVITASAQINSNFSGSNIDDLEGSIFIDYAKVNLGINKYAVKEVKLEATGNQYRKSLRLNSDLLDAQIDGSFKLLELDKSVKMLLNSFLPSFTLFDIGKITEKPFDQSFAYAIQMKDIELLSDLFFPFIRLSSEGSIKGDFSSSQKRLTSEINIAELKVMNYELEKFYLNARSTGNALELVTSARKFQITDSLQLHRLSLDAKARGDTIGYTFNWSNAQKSDQEGELNGNIYFRGADIAMHILPSYILIKDQQWIVSDDNELSFNNKNLSFYDLSFINNEQFIRIDGAISSDPEKELDVILDNFQLENINAFMPELDILFKGKAKGMISLSNLYENPNLKSNLTIDRFHVNDILLGDGEILSRYDLAQSKFIIDASLRRDTLRTFRMTGSYDPKNEKDAMNLSVNLRNIQMRLFQPFLADIFSEVDGFLNGAIHLKGTFKNPELTGQLKVNKGRLLVDYLNTAYTFSHEITLTKNTVEIKDMTIFDLRANTGKVNFTLRHNNFSDFYLDLVIEANRLQALNTVEQQNDLFYGTAFASGTFKAYGPFDNLKMDVAARTERGTVFNLPLYGAEEINQDNFITFVDSRNPQPLELKQRRKIEPKGFEMNFALEVTPDAEALLIFDPQVGDVIKGRGRGNLRLEITESGEFLLFGEYTINQGEYLFTLQNVFNKRFEVENGGTITWRGDPIDADINLSAIYPTRTSLYELVKQVDTSAVFRRKIDVQAILIMKDKLLNPSISFDIRFPNSDDNTRNLAMSQIPNEDEMSKQVMGLLIFNQFFPVSGGIGEGRGSGGVGSNASELLSNQLSNWLSKLSDNVDIGVNYRTGNPQSADEITIQLSTQLSDRITFDGNFGQVSNVNNPQTTNLVGEFNIEVRITDDGRLRMKIFNRSNQYILITNDVPYTQGVGLFYRREFESFSDLNTAFRLIPKGKKANQVKSANTTGRNE
ncbi:MAG: translocation/assembly module TamB domain-containing protein [Flavobacteriales bacterium]